LYGQEQLSRYVSGFIVAAMQLRNFMNYVEDGKLIVVPGDRADVIVACLAIVSSLNAKNISGILLTGGLKPEKSICELIEGFPMMIPILT
jgi:phosphate acetyltransferase